MKIKSITCLMLAILLMFSSFILSSCEDDVQTFTNESPIIDNNGNLSEVIDEYVVESQYKPDEIWAIYLYLCGSDLESEYGAATADLYEILNVTLPENVYIVIQTGGSSYWNNDYVDANNIYRLSYYIDTLYLVDTQPLSSMGDQETLEDFLRFCNDKAPADHKAVIFWNHGGGSLNGVAFDEMYTDEFGRIDSLELLEIYSAFESVFELSEENPPFELIGFAACLMATLETAYMCRDIAKYMVASEESEPGCGWDYTGFLQALADNPGMNGAMLGKAICDTYQQFCDALDIGRDITLSVVDLRRITSVVAAYNNIGIETLSAVCVNPSLLTYLGRSADSAEKYGDNNNARGYTNMVDLGDLVRKFVDYGAVPNTAQSILEALEQCVVYRVNGPYRAQSSGLSVYYPYDMDINTFNYYAALAPSDAYVYLYDCLIEGGISEEVLYYAYNMTYDEAVPVFSAHENPSVISSITPGEIPNFQNYPVEYTLYIEDGEYSVLEVGSEISMLSAVNYYLAYYYEEYNSLIYLGKDNNIYRDWEAGRFADNFMGYWGSIDGHIVYMEIIDEEENYDVFAVPIVLNDMECSLYVCYDYTLRDWEIIGARAGIDENGMADKNLIQLKPGDVITPIYYIFDMYDEYSYGVEPFYDEQFIVEESPLFYEVDLGDGLFIITYEMVDAHNNSVFSQDVYVTLENGMVYRELD